jgi:signal transduction histidine kinase
MRSKPRKHGEELRQAHNELELRVQQRTQDLSEKTEEVRQLTVRLLRLQDEERRRIARELHDSTGQMLAAMKMFLDQMRLEAKVEKISALVTQTIAINEDMTRQLRTMSYLLHPPLLDEMGLPSALQWYADGFAQRSGISVDLKTSPEFGRLPDDMEIALFRTVQESLTNIHRHSGSQTARIRLSRTSEAVDLEIADTGNGIPPQRLHGDQVIAGVGIMGIHERMRQFGGNAEIGSSAKGTVVQATIPLKNPLRDAV